MTGLEHSDFSNKNLYWERFYSKKPDRKPAPSQFAAFVAQETDASMIIEVGCGNGRDSLFFADLGFNVFGMDGSEAAIETCQASAIDRGIERVEFRCATVGTSEFETALSSLRKSHSGSVMVYARFFLHAISENEQDSFFRTLRKSLAPGDRVAFEYRTLRDAAGAKVTSDHYRRYISPPDIFSAASHLGFNVEYAVEGYGLAKFRHDDAFVARCIMRLP